MFHLIPEDIIVEACKKAFSVLDERYIEGQSRTMIDCVSKSFDEDYETRFVIVDRFSMQPVNVNAVFADPDSAEAALSAIEEDKHDIATMLLYV